MQTLERGDIEIINFGGHNGTVTEVRGYQNYNITNGEIVALNNPTSRRPWVDTKIKSNFFKKIFLDLAPKTYIDFGSNLGYYVFWAAHRGIASTGIDYSQEYFSVCNAIKARHKIDCANFINSNLQNSLQHIDPKEFMTVFNVIHHLYNRTEQYMDMEQLVGDFAKLAENILFEVPTENDPKGHKWTVGTGYTEELFLSTAGKMFDKVECIAGQTEHRPYYMCTGSKLV